MKSDKGISTLALIVMMAVILAIGGSGYYFYISRFAVQSKNNLSGPASTDVRLSPYKGWKTYTLKYEKLAFMYPPTWSILDSTDSKWVNVPELDGLAVNGPDGFQIGIGAGQPVTSVTMGGEPKVLGADKLTFLGKNAYMVYTSSPTGNIVDLAYLNASPTNTAPQYISKHVIPKAIALGVTQGNLVVAFGYTGNTAGVNKYQSLAQARQDPNFSATKAVIASMHY